MTAGLLSAVAFATGAAVMVVELMAVRLMAPWFGQSQLVWTNVIGVVLAALAVGQWLGGRWSEGKRGPRPAGLMVLAGLASLALPDLVRWMSPALLPEDLPLLEAYPFVTLGSLLVALTTIGLPMVALGAVTPGLVRLSAEAQRVPGRVAGRLLAAGTAGSLLGSFGATHVLLGWLGSAGAVRLAGAVLVVVGIVVARSVRSWPRTALWFAALPLAAAALPSASPPGRVLEAVETPYQWAWVEEQPDGTRLLRLNEGLDSFHSVWKPDALWTGMYYDAFVYPAVVAPKSGDGVLDVAIVGLAGGTMASQILRVMPDTRVVGIELDEAVVELGRRWFHLPEAVETLSGVDGRVALETSPRRYGALLVDAYAQQIYLPPHLCTTEFFALARERLLDGGVVALNLGGITREDPVVAAVAGTFAAVFPGATMARVPGTRNMIALGWKGEAPTPDRAESALRDAGLLEALRWMSDGVGFASIAEAPDGALRDGDAPVEALAHDAWQGRIVERAPGDDASGGPASDVLARAQAHYADLRLAEADALLRRIPVTADGGIRAEAALLRGNIAFEHRRFDRSREHYEAAVTLFTEGGADRGRGLAESNLAMVNDALALRSRLQTRARWLWGGLGLGLAAALAIVVALRGRAG